MGHGPPLVIPPQLVTHLEADLVEGPFADTYEALARHHTLVRYDTRGTGLSDRRVRLTSEQFSVLDLAAVVDELRLDKFPLYGLCWGGPLALRYYAKHPNRVSQLIFYGTSFEPVSAERKRQSDVTRAVTRASWEIGSKMRIERLMPHGGTREDIERLARWLRLSVSSDVLERLMELRQKRDDLPSILANVSVPTLVIHRRGDHVPFSGGREVAAQIRGARLLALEGYNHLPATYEEAMELVIPVVDFLAKGQDGREALLAEVSMPITVLFVAIEGSTSVQRRAGDYGDKKLLRGHYDAVRREIESYNGNEVKPNGKGVAASLFSASRAVGCALHIQRVIAKRNAVNPDDAVNVRIGLDAVEPLAQADDFNGDSIQLARRISESAAPGEVLVSDAVRHLVSGKGFKFEPAGVKPLEGLEKPVPLYKLGVE
jgi:class 3 adenylate cyclase